MSRVLDSYVTWVDAFNRMVGRVVMYVLLFGLLGVLLYSSVASPVFGVYPIWPKDTSQFLMVSYFMLGGAYSLQLDGHVRMDVLFSQFSARTQAIMDAITSFAAMFYLVILLYGGISAAQYALENHQKNFTAWGPPMAPIKIAMCVGILMMLLQFLSNLIKDIAIIRGMAGDE